MECPNCGADCADTAATCAYCDSALPDVQASRLREGAEQQAERFRRIHESVAYANRNSPDRHVRLLKATPLQKAFAYIFFTAFIGISGFIATMMIAGSGIMGFSRFGGFGFSLIPLLMSIVPIGFVVFGVIVLCAIRQRMRAIETGAVEATAVIIVDKRAQHSTDSDGDRSSRYFLTSEDESGRRKEQPVWGDLYGQTTAGDAGVLFVRGGFVVGFDRVQ